MENWGLALLFLPSGFWAAEPRTSDFSGNS